jgi:cobalt/nickel transport system ATP-binding protein
LDRAFAWADQVALFHEGKVLVKDAPAAVFADVERLREVNLKQPAVLKLFQTLISRGMLDSPGRLT